MSTNSRYALLAWVTFWNGRLNFLIATFSLVAESYAALTTTQVSQSDTHIVQQQWTTVFMVLSSWHSHRRSSFDECSTSAGWQPTSGQNQL